MEIRKIIYHVNYIHLLNFKDHYKKLIAPYFTYEPLEYGIDNENTIDESIRLIFKKEGFAFQIRKDGISMWYEGDISLIKKSNPKIDLFFEIFEKIKTIPGFVRIIRHKMVSFAIQFEEESTIKEALNKNKFFRNPFGQLDEFATIFNFTQDEKIIEFKLGNYSKRDIKKFNLSDLNVEYNNDLKENVGYLFETSITEDTLSTSFTKLKELIKYSENISTLYFKD